jgi:ketosteroid isomerase-like protein
MESELQDFEEFMKLRATIAQAYVNGDAEPLARISSRDLPGTFFGPGGDYELGAEEVLARYKRDARNFVSGDTTFEILETGASGELAYWIGFQRATMKLKGRDEVIPMSLRVTEIFRRDREGWKLIHRHADFLKDTSEY